MLVLLGGALFHGLYWLLKAALPALLLRAVAKVPGREGVARSLDRYIVHDCAECMWVIIVLNYFFNLSVMEMHVAYSILHFIRKHK